MIVVGALMTIAIDRANGLVNQGFFNIWNAIELVLFGISILLLIVVYFLLRNQRKLKNEVDKLIIDNHELLLSIVNNTSNPISIKKINGEYLLVNDQFKSLFQISDENIIGKSDQEILPKDIADEYRKSDLKVLKAEKELKLEEKIVEIDGVHTYLSAKFPLFDTSGRIYAIASIGTDISKRKTSEESLKYSDTFFKMSLDIMVIASKDKFVKINPSISRILGYPNKQLLEKPFKTFIYPEDIEKTEREIEKLQSVGETLNFENRWVTKNKEIIWLSWIAKIDRDTGLMYALAHDITINKKNRDDLKVANTFFDLSYDLMLVIQNNYIVKINAAFTRVLGFSQKDVKDKTLLSFTHADDVEQIRLIMEKLIKGETAIHFRARFKCKNELYTVLEYTATYDQGAEEIFIVARDVSKLIEKEESLNLVNSFFELGTDGFIVAKGKNIIKVNPSFTELTGYALDDVKNNSVLDFIKEDYKKIANERIEKRFKGEKIEEAFKYPILIKNGTYKWVEAIVSVDSEKKLIYAILRDISEKEKNDKILKIANTFFNLSLDIMVILTDHTFMKVNPFTSTVLGYSETELLEKNYTEFIHPEDLKSTTDTLDTLTKANNQVDIQARWICKDASVKWLFWTFTLDAEQKLIYGIARDITEQLKLEEEEEENIKQLYQNEQRLKLIIDNISDGVLVANVEKKILVSNQLADEIYGTKGVGKRSAVLSDTFEIYSPIDDSVFPAQNLPLSRALEGEVTDDVDVILLNRETLDRKRFLLSGRPLVDEDNIVVAAVVTMRDITKYKQLEKELKDVESKLKSSIGFKKA